MLKELTINVEEDVYDALLSMVESQQLDVFLADVLQKSRGGGCGTAGLSVKGYPRGFDMRLKGAASPDLYGKGEVSGDIVGPFHEEWGDL